MLSTNEIILKVEVISQPKKVLVFDIQPNINKPTFFLCDKEMNEKNFVNAGNENEEELADFEELNSENCEMYLNDVKIPFEKYHTFDKEGIYTIKYILTKKITSCKKMFMKCEHIISIDLSKFNTEDVIDMSLMFLCCTGLENINFGNMKTSKVINMEGMFECCSSLKSLNLSSFDTSNIENMNSMFLLCLSLPELNLSNFNTEKVKDMNTCFGGLFLEFLDLSSFSSKNLEIINFMFKNCVNLKHIKFSKKFQPNNIHSMYGTFSNCDNLEIIECSEDLYDVFVEKQTSIYNLGKVKFVDLDGPKPDLKEFKSQYHEHILKKELLNHAECCEGCALTYNDAEIFECKECKFYMCPMCVKIENKKGYIALKGALHQHEMKLQSNLKECNCKICNKLIPVKKGYYCQICDIAYCKKCTSFILISAILNFSKDS